MAAKRLLVLFLGVAFLVGTAGLAVAQEKKAAQPCAAKPAMKPKVAEGTLKSVSDTSIMVEDKDKKEWTFAVTGKVAEAAKKLKAGDMVRVSYTEGDGKMMASRVTAAKMEKKAQPCAAKDPGAAKK